MNKKKMAIDININESKTYAENWNEGKWVAFSHIRSLPYNVHSSSRLVSMPSPYQAPCPFNAMKYKRPPCRLYQWGFFLKKKGGVFRYELPVIVSPWVRTAIIQWF